MLSKQEAHEKGFRIEFTINKEGEVTKWIESFDGGKTWREWTEYNPPRTQEQVETQRRNRFYVRHVLKPNLNDGEDLCIPCANQGKVGIVKYAGRIHGREAQCVVRYDDAGEPYTCDEYFSVSYDQWKCTSCGDLADSEYA